MQHTPLIEESESFGSTDSFLSDKLGVDPQTEQALKSRIEAFSQFKQDAAVKYLEESTRRETVADSHLLILSGVRQDCADRYAYDIAADLLLSENSSSIGYFLRWKGKGIAINPGEGFIDQLHKNGFFATDIDICIITSENPDAYEDIFTLYELNFQLNKINPEHKVIHYYLNQKTHREIAHKLKPHFKQERNTVHCLELFVDSPEVETMTLSTGILLHYFAAQKQMSSTLGIQLELDEGVRIGYVSGTPWTPFIAANLASTDLLITGFGQTHPNDFGKLHYNEECLGYFGISSLIEEVKPKLVLVTEFDGTDGDIRLEVARKLRKESKTDTTILPADTGMLFDLNTFQIACSVTGEKVGVQEVELIKTQEMFGALKTVAPSTKL